MFIVRIPVPKKDALYIEAGHCLLYTTHAILFVLWFFIAVIALLPVPLPWTAFLRKLNQSHGLYMRPSRTSSSAWKIKKEVPGTKATDDWQFCDIS